MSSHDERFMIEALRQAELAKSAGEVPVGAVLVKNNLLFVAEHNRREELSDATAHAELLLLRRAGSMTGGWRLNGFTMYVTLEPCSMCAGALVLARVDRLVYGTKDPKSGAAGSLYDIVRDARLNHCLEVHSGILEKECAILLQSFFKSKR